VSDCRGSGGPRGPRGIQGINGTDGTCTLSMCTNVSGPAGDKGSTGGIGIRGTNGTDGYDCWDLNRNYACNLASEDMNSDGVCNVTDCRGDTGIQGNTGATVRSSVLRVFDEFRVQRETLGLILS